MWLIDFMLGEHSNSNSLINSKPVWIRVPFPLKKITDVPNRVSEYTLKSHSRLCFCLYYVVKNASLIQ